MTPEQFLVVQTAWCGNSSLHDVAELAGLSLDLRSLMSEWGFESKFPKEHNYGLLLKGLSEPRPSAEEGARRRELVLTLSERVLPYDTMKKFRAGVDQGEEYIPYGPSDLVSLLSVALRNVRQQQDYDAIEVCVAHAFYCAFADPAYPLELLVAWCTEGTVTTTDNWETGVREIRCTRELPAKYEMKS